MNLNEMRHETLDVLQTIYVLTARLKQLVPPEAADQREILDQLVRRAQQCRDRLADVAAPDPGALAPTEDTGLPKLRVMVVEDDPEIRQYLTESITKRCGHEVVATAASGKEMIRRGLAHNPDLVVMDIHLPDMDGPDALRQLTQTEPIAAVAITGDRDPELVKRALEDNILAYLLKPVDDRQLRAAIQVAWARFQEFCALRSENETLQQTLQDRKLIEKAKGVLMQRHRCSEPTAFRWLQRTAMNKRVRMVDLARDILDGKDLT